MNSNVEIVRRLMQRFVEQDVDGFLADVDPDAELDWSHSDAPDSDVYSGHAGWLAFLRARDEVLVGRDIEFLELLSAPPDTVVLIARIREQGRVSRAGVAVQGAAVFTLREGKVVRLKVYRSSDQALQAAGLSR